MIPLLIATAVVAAPAADPASLFVKASNAYAEGEFQKSTDLYEQLTAQGLDSGYVWYNLGNCYLRTGNLGAAVAAYLRSQSQLPRDADVRANLAFARRSAKDAIEPTQSAAVVRALIFWHFALSRLELLQAIVVANILLWLLVAWRLFRRESEILRWATMATLVVVVAVGASFIVRVAVPRRVAVVQPVEITVHSGTSRDTVVQFKLHAGTEVEWLETRGEWLRVGLPDEKQGWVHHGDVVALVL